MPSNKKKFKASDSFMEKWHEKKIAAQSFCFILQSDIEKK